MDNQNASTNANVVLSADVSGYTQQLQAAEKQTNVLSTAVNKVATSLDGITKRAGKKITLFAAADQAALAGFVTLASNYQKELKQIDVTLTKSQDSIKKYSKGINEMTLHTGKSRSEVSALTLQIRQMGITTQAENQKLTTTFLSLAKATNSSLPGITGQMMELGRQMGTLGSAGAGSMQKFSDSLVSVSQNAGVSAEGVLQFANSIAPIGRAANMTEKDIIGISGAFVRAGADGFAAANTFNTMTTEIARSSRNGSPDLLKYANLVGVSLEKFKNTNPAERLVEIFEAINKKGPDAVNTLDQLGFDGIRAAKAIQAVSNEAGGIRSAVFNANNDYGNGATEDQAAKGKNLQDTLAKSKNSLMEMGSAIGEGALPGMTALATMAQKFLEKITPLVDPFAKIAGFIASMVGNLGLVIGPIIGAMGMFSKIGLAQFALGQFKKSGFKQGMDDVKHGVNVGPSFIGPMREGQERVTGLRGQTYEMGQSVGAARAQSGGLTKAIGYGAAAPFTAIKWGAAWNKNFYRNAAGLDNTDNGTFHADARSTWDLMKSQRQRAIEAHQKGVEAYGETKGSKMDKRSAYDSAVAKHLEATAAAAPKVTSAFKRLAAAATGAATQMTKAGMWNVTQGVKGVAKAGGGLLARGASSALGMVGGPAALGMTAGLYAYSSIKGGIDDQNTTVKKVESTTARYDAALGTATQSVTTFSESLMRASDAAKAKGMSAKDVLGADINYKDTSAANSSEYKDERVKTLNSKQGALGYLQSLGNLDPEHATAVRQDFVKKFGAGAQDIFSAYNQGNSGLNSQYSGSSYNLAREAAGVGNRAAADAINPITKFQRIVIDPGQESQDLINQSWNAGQQRAASLSNMYGDKVVGQATRAGVMDFASGAVAGINDSGSSGQANMLKNAYSKQLEQMPMFSGGLGNDFITTLEHSNGNMESAVSSFLEKNKGSEHYDELFKFFDGFTNDYKKALDAATQKKDSFTDTEKAFRGTKVGAFMRDNGRVQAATSAEGNKVGDASEVSGASTAIAKAMLKESGGSTSKAIKLLMEGTKGRYSGDTENSAITGSIAQIEAIQSQKSITQDRGTNWKEQLQTARVYKGNTDSGELGDQARKKGSQMELDTKQNFLEFVKSMISAQKSFDITMQRGQEDYHRQMAYGEEDFYRSRREANADFLKSRNDQQKDYDKSLKRQVEDAAKSLYDPYQRVQAAYTSDTGSTLINLREQQQQIQNQVVNLKKAKKMGLSQGSIDMLSLSDASNAQQLERYMQEWQNDPSSIGKINKSANSRKSATKDLVQNENSTAWKRQVEDYKTGLSRSERDFDTSMNRSQKSFMRSVKRSDEAQARSVQRAKEDFIRMYDEVTANGLKGQKGLVTKATKWLNDVAGPKLAGGLIKQLKDMSNTIDWSAVFQPDFLKASNPSGKTNAGGAATGNAATRMGGRAGYTGRVGHNADGGIAMSNTLTRIAEAGPEMVLPLNTRGEQFMANTMKRATAEVVKGMMVQSSPALGGGTTTINTHTSNYVVEKVVAQDPNEMARKLKEKQRLNSLRHPTKG